MKKANYNIILVLLALIIFCSMWKYDIEDFFRYKSHTEDYDIIEVEITDIAIGLNHRRLKFQYNIDGTIMSGTIEGHLWDNIGSKVMVAVKKSEPYVYTRTDICIFPTIIGVYIFLIVMIIEGIVKLFKTDDVRRVVMEKRIKNMLIFNKLILLERLVILLLGMIILGLVVAYLENRLFQYITDNRWIWEVVIYIADLGLLFLCGIVMYKYIIDKINNKKIIQKRAIVKKVEVNRKAFDIGVYNQFFRYYFIIYLVENDTTYMFECEILDYQKETFDIFKKIKKNGVFPRINVYVDPDNYYNYYVPKYDFIRDLFDANKEIVSEFYN